MNTLCLGQSSHLFLSLDIGAFRLRLRLPPRTPLLRPSRFDWNHTPGSSGPPACRHQPVELLSSPDHVTQPLTLPLAT